jgi:hypothetical protein
MFHCEFFFQNYNYEVSSSTGMFHCFFQFKMINRALTYALCSYHQSVLLVTYWHMVAFFFN